MSDHLDRIVDHRRHRKLGNQLASDQTGEGATSLDPLERISVYLELINNADSRAEALAGMAGTALGVFFAAFIAAFVAEAGTKNPVLEVADLISEILFVAGAFLLLRCIFQALRPNQIQDPWNEDELARRWVEVTADHERAARSFWSGTVLLALSIGILIVADVLIDLGFFAV